MVRTKQMARPSSGPVVAQRNKQDPSAKKVAARFETFGSALTALLLLYGAAVGLLLLMISDANNSVVDSLSSVIWTFVLGFQMIIVLGPGFPTFLLRPTTYLTTVLLLALPHLPICSSGLGAATGAAQGAASILVCCRSFQLLRRIEEGDEKWLALWGRWRRVYQGCALSWHDVDETCTSIAPVGHFVLLCQQLALYVIGLTVPCVIITLLPPPPAMFSLLMAARCFAMSGAMVCAFNVFDLTYLLLLCFIHGVSVKSIMAGSFWTSQTVKEIWKGWNLPVQRLLGSGVYLPLRKVGISRPVARLLVFVVSGMGHVYPCYVAGLSLHLISFMMIFFIVQVLLVSFEDVVGIRSGVWCIGIEIVLSPLFVMPVLFFTDPALIT